MGEGARLPGNDNEGRFLPPINSRGHEGARIVCILGSGSFSNMLYMLCLLRYIHTGCLQKTVTSNISLTDLKITRNGVT